MPRRLETSLVLFDPAALIRTVPVLLVLFVAGSLTDPWTYVGLVLLVIFVAVAFTPITVAVRDEGLNFAVEARRWPFPVQRVEVDPARVLGFTLVMYTVKTMPFARDKQARIDLVTEDGARELLRGLPEKHRHLPELVARIDQFAREGRATRTLAPLAAAAPVTNLLHPRE